MLLPRSQCQLNKTLQSKE